MSGKDVFVQYSLLIKIVVSFFRLMPSEINIIVWNYIENWHGVCGIGLRYCILKASIDLCGDNVFIGPFVEIKHWYKLRIGNNVSIHSHCYIDAIGGVEIGNEVSIAHSSSILSSNHSWDDPSVPIKYNKIKLQRVIIQDDVWIGCGCRILGGIKIEKRSIIAAGAVVTNDIEGNSIYGGVPAKKIRQI